MLDSLRDNDSSRLRGQSKDRLREVAKMPDVRPRLRSRNPDLRSITRQRDVFPAGSNRGEFWQPKPSTGAPRPATEDHSSSGSIMRPALVAVIELEPTQLAEMPAEEA